MKFLVMKRLDGREADENVHWESVGEMSGGGGIQKKNLPCGP